MNVVRHFRLVSLIEGCSFLFLVLIAMPLKYGAHIPEPVKYKGWLHGMLFIWFSIALLLVLVSGKWSFFRCAGAFILSLIPFGAIWLEYRLRREDQA